MDQENLFESFSSINKEEWIAKATTDLKGKDFDETLVWKTDEGFSVMPFYNKEDLAHLDYLKAYQNGAFDENRDVLGSRNWQNRQIVVVQDEKQANQEALHALNNGADAITFDLTAKNQYDFNILFKDILFEYCGVAFKVDQAYTTFLEELNAFLKAKEVDLSSVQGALNVEGMMMTTAHEYLQITQAFPQFNCLTITHEQLDTPVTEKVAAILKNTLTVINELIEKGAVVEDVLGNIEFEYRLSNNYFFELAGLRALRLLISGMAKEYGLKAYEPSHVMIHAKTSITVSEETTTHPEWNMLSNTNQAMAAIIGGCNSLSILPHTLGIKEGAAQDSFANRIARNVSNILKEEAYFDKVADPAAGSYYIENLTHKIAEKSWQLFQASL